MKELRLLIGGVVLLVLLGVVINSSEVTPDEPAGSLAVEVEPPFGSDKLPTVFEDQWGNHWLCWDSEAMRWYMHAAGPSKICLVQISPKALLLKSYGMSGSVRVDDAQAMSVIIVKLLKPKTLTQSGG